MPSPAANETALRIRSSIVSRDTPSASSLRSEIGDSITEAPTPSSIKASTSACTARENPQTSARRPAADDQLEGAAVVLGHAREPGLDAVDAELVESLGDLELVLGREHHAHGLLPVAQRGVVEADRARAAVGVVEASGPDLVAVDHVARKSSG